MSESHRDLYKVMCILWNIAVEEYYHQTLPEWPHRMQASWEVPGCSGCDSSSLMAVSLTTTPLANDVFLWPYTHDTAQFDIVSCNFDQTCPGLLISKCIKNSIL